MSEVGPLAEGPTPSLVGSSGPLRQVIAAVAAGAASRREVARQTGLSSATVDAAVDHLVHTGRLTTASLGVSCASGGCRTCPSGRADDGPGCGALAAHQGRGPVVLTLAPRPQGSVSRADGAPAR